MKNLKKLSLFLIVLITTVLTYGDVTNDVEQIKADLAYLKNKLAGGSINSSVPSVKWYTYNGQISNTGAGYVTAMYNQLQELARYFVVTFRPLFETLGTDVGTIKETLSALDVTLSTINDNVSSLSSAVYNIDNGINNILYLLGEVLPSLYSDFLDFKTNWDYYNGEVLSHLYSIDNNVASIADNVERGEGYLSDIYNSISAGINVNLESGFPEPYDYTSLLELMAYNSIWSKFEDYRANRVGRLYLSGGVTWSHLGDMTTNATVKTGITLSGDFFSDVTDLLAASDEKLAGIQKSLMLIYENLAKSSEVDPDDLARQELEETGTDIPETSDPLKDALSYPSINPYTESPSILGLSGGSSLPPTITFHLPSGVFSDQGDIIISTSDYATAFTTARWVCRFGLWSLVLFLALKLFGLFSKCVLSPILSVAKKWVGGAVNV